MSENNTLYKNLIKNRICQLLINNLINTGKFKIPIHLALGHEAIATALKAAVHDQDGIFCTHRNIHYNLAFHQNFLSEIHELLLLPTGIAGGKLGSMNMFLRNSNIQYSSSILGNNLAVAVGYAQGCQLRSELNESVTFVVTGDGAIEEGIFYESLLYAASNQLKICFLIENNKWSLATSINERRSAINLRVLGESLGITYNHLFDNSILGYKNCLVNVRKNIIANKCPAILEVDLTTLGYQYAKDGRYINYHAGAIRNIVFNAQDIIISDIGCEDPISVCKKELQDFESYCAEVISLVVKDAIC